MEIKDPKDINMKSYGSDKPEPSEDYYLAALVGVIDVKDIPKNAKVVNEKTFKNLQDKIEKEKNKDKKTPKPTKPISRKEKLSEPVSMARVSDIVL